MLASDLVAVQRLLVDQGEDQEVGASLLGGVDGGGVEGPGHI